MLLVSVLVKLDSKGPILYMQDRLGQLQVSDAMSEGVVTVSAGDPAAMVARTLRENRLHHVFVIDEGSLVGVVSAYDLLGLIEDLKDV